MRTAATNAVGGYVRGMLGWSLTLPKAEQQRIKAQAAKMLNGQSHSDNPGSAADNISPLVAVLRESVAPIDERVSELERDIRTIVRTLPEWDGFFAGVRGVAEVSAANMLAIVGDPAKWSNPAKMWKRLGLAPRVAGDTTGETTYRPHARAVMWVIGDCLIKSGSPYKAVYNARREHTATTHPDWTKIHSHKDAHRVMVKRLACDLWTWTRANP